MVKIRNRTLPRRALFLLLFFFFSTIGATAQTAPVPRENSASDVVMLALQALTPEFDHTQHVTEGLLDTVDHDLAVEQHLREIQMAIVRATANFGPVLLLAPDDATKSAISERCQQVQICELLKSDRVRIKVAPHDGAWIRDFGPQIEAVGDSARVVHWRYFDLRKEEARREKFQELETARLQLLETRQQEEQQSALAPDATPESQKAVVSAIDAKLYTLQQYAQILREASVQRSNDEDSAYDIADAVLAVPDFNYRSSPIALDGGNLEKLDDGRCLTTRVLLTRNKGQSVNLDSELEKLAGCKSVTYLEPLPGPVTEHIDMFALPVGGKRILLASYDLRRPFAAEYWSQLSPDERDLAMNAALAMDSDAEELTRLGYEVIAVPSPFPRIPANGHIYYPSVLNALVRRAPNGYRQVLVPSYKDYEPDIQSAAMTEIKSAFGAKTEIDTIEATEAAKSQGAVHCLTLNAPLRLSIFSDPADAARRAAYQAHKDQLDRQAADEIASQIPATGLEGSWAILQPGDQPEVHSDGQRETPSESQSDNSSRDLYPQKFFFTATEFQKGVLHRLESRGSYTIDSRSPACWSLHFRFQDEHLMPAQIQWLSKDELKLILDNGASTLFLKRLSSGNHSPFQP